MVTAPKTAATQADGVRLHLMPGLGGHELGKRTPQHVPAPLRTKTDAGPSLRMVHHVRAVLRCALNQAMRWGLISRNDGALVEPPRQVQLDVQPLTPAEAPALLAAVEVDRLAVLFRVALTLGLRQGEVLGLMWEDVVFERRTLKVRPALLRTGGALILKEPRTVKSRRTLTLPPSLAAALRAHKVRQLEERLLAGERWQDHGLVFPNTLGAPSDARTVIRSWHRAQAASGLPRRSFHSTRHAAASLMLAEGVPVKLVQEVLGHSLLSTTADIYGHLFPEAFQEAADAMERVLVG